MSPSKILYTYEHPTSIKHLEETRKVLMGGGVIAYPTDVNWALGCLATHKKALTKLSQLKKNTSKKLPFSLIFASMSQVCEYADVSNSTYRLLRKMLPGPYTLLLPRHKRLPKILQDSRLEVGVRVPDRPLLIDLLKELPCPLATTTVYLPTTQTPELPLRPRFGYEIEEHFGSRIDLILDLSTEIPPLETTVIKITAQGMELIRQGLGEVPTEVICLKS